MQGVRRLCDTYGILIIADEVMAGVGRTGDVWAHRQLGIDADIITAAKGLTAAYLPLGATIVTERIAKHFEENVFYGGLTYAARPCCV